MEYTISSKFLHYKINDSSVVVEIPEYIPDDSRHDYAIAIMKTLGCIDDYEKGRFPKNTKFEKFLKSQMNYAIKTDKKKPS